MPIYRYQEFRLRAELRYENLRQRNSFIDARVADNETRYLLVNKSEYYLRVFDGGVEEVRENVVVGQPGRQTPEFSDVLKYIVVNPYWNVPPGLARKNIVPKLNRIRNAYDIERMYKSITDGGYRFFSFSGHEELDPHDIDFSSFTRSSRIPFMIRQEPGVHNSLGSIKFIFPNKYNVYIHDTPHKELFNRKRRNFSSGCVRMQNPIKLAAYLLDVTNSDIMDIINTNGNDDRWIKVPNPLPIHIVDWDIVVTEHGVILK